MYIVNPISKQKLLLKDNLDKTRNILKHYVIFYLNKDKDNYIDKMTESISKINKKQVKTKTNKNWWDNEKSYWKKIFED